MGDYFIEQLVKRNATVGTILAKAALILVTVLSLFVMLLFPLGIWLTIILVVVDVFLFKRMDVEYEYSFYNGELDIDKVMAKESRKRQFSTTIKDMDLLAPTGAQELLGYQRLKAVDYSTRTAGSQTYEMVTFKGGEKVRMIFEPNEEMLNAMRDLAPRKVVLSLDRR